MTQTTPQFDLFRNPLLQLLHAHRARFPDDVITWLPANLHVYAAFRREALDVHAQGFEHYSARTIIEWLRHHTAVRERSADEWKLNDHYTPYLARLFDMAEPHAAGLFEYRRTTKVVTPLGAAA